MQYIETLFKEELAQAANDPNSMDPNDHYTSGNVHNLDNSSNSYHNNSESKWNKFCRIVSFFLSLSLSTVYNTAHFRVSYRDFLSFSFSVFVVDVVVYLVLVN